MPSSSRTISPSSSFARSVTGEYRNLDLLLSDKVRIKDRGSNVDAGISCSTGTTIIGGDDAISVMRGSATAQRREHELIAIDPDQDYTAVPSLSKIPRDPMVISAAVGKETATLPLVIDANTRQALATFSQNYQENARRRIAFKVRAAGYGIEPGDLFALTDIADGFDNEVFKCTQTTHGANWVVEVEGEAILRCSIYRRALSWLRAICVVPRKCRKVAYSFRGASLRSSIADIEDGSFTDFGRSVLRPGGVRAVRHGKYSLARCDTESKPADAHCGGQWHIPDRHPRGERRVPRLSSGVLDQQLFRAWQYPGRRYGQPAGRSRRCQRLAPVFTSSATVDNTRPRFSRTVWRRTERMARSVVAVSDAAEMSRFCGSTFAGL